MVVIELKNNFLDDIDSIVFDCDGVLVDIRNSYDKTIDKTTLHFINKFTSIPSFSVSHKIIDSFKSSGGFNDEVDLSYALILTIVSADRLNRNPVDFIDLVSSNLDKTGILSVEKFLKKLIDISDVIKKLDFPGPRLSNPLNSIFDQFFYGPELYQKLFDRKSSILSDGLIKNDIVLIDESLFDELESRFGKKISIVTGRGLESARFSLKKLLDRFNLESSFFLEDESRDLAKPNPESLIQSIKKMNSKHCLFVGDSMEELFMSKDATKLGFKTTFCGITGTSSQPKIKEKLFIENGAKLILNSIQSIPNILNDSYVKS